MVTVASVLAVALLVLPTALFVALRLRATTRVLDLALDVPTGFALDVLSVLLLARAMPIDHAAIASRVLWLGVAAVVARRLRREGRLARPTTFPGSDVALLAAGGLVAVGASALLSVPYAIWDRRWHTPLVASVRGQTLPFSNVYQPGFGLPYHHAGDDVAAILQALSGATIHASRALSLAHDALFGLTGIALAALFVWAGARKALVVALAVLAVLLAGPITLFEGGISRPSAGFAWFSYLTLSFRPHVALAGLLLTGFVAAVLARLDAPSAAHDRTAPALGLGTALLAITDEASVGLVGLALGVTWLLDPQVLHPRRMAGATGLAALGVTLVGSNAVLSGALRSGAPRQLVELVRPRVPGVDAPSLALPTQRGLVTLAADLGLFVAVVAVAGLVARHPRRASERLEASFFGVLVGTSILGLLCVEVNRSPGESHRFVTAAAFVAPLLAVVWLFRRGGASDTLSERPVGFTAIVVGGLGLASASTLEWVATVAGAQCDRDATFFTRVPLRDVDCRAATNARLGERPRPTYLARSVAYLYAGCRPVFTPPTESNGWALAVGFVEEGALALRALDAKMLGADEPLVAICPPAPAAGDATCRAAARLGTCAPEGTGATRCEVAPEARRALAAGR